MIAPSGTGMIRIGFDIGGTKLAAIALDPDGAELARMREDVPRDYAATLQALLAMAASLEERHGRAGSIGIGMPGMIGSQGELRRVVNLPWLEGRPLRGDLEAASDRPVAIANDANCFALSEAIDGAAADAEVVFGVTLGTGVGGGIVINRRPLAGANAIAGEWGHNPLPTVAEADGEPVRCGCGRLGCIETWLNGAALRRDFLLQTGHDLDPTEVARRAAEGEVAAQTALGRYQARLAKALGSIINFLDPDAIVLGGGLSAISSHYETVPKSWHRFTVARRPVTRLLQARFGGDSGLRGAAWLGRQP